jgi:hypothetical protein
MPRDEDIMNINLTEYGDCIVIRGTYRVTGNLSVLITDLENRIIALISKDLPNASSLSDNEFYFDSKQYANLSSQLLALPEFTKTLRKTKSTSIFDNNIYYIWKYTGA